MSELEYLQVITKYLETIQGYLWLIVFAIACYFILGIFYRILLHASDI